MRTVADNGIGIHPDARHKTNAFSLAGIQERVGMLNGELGIEGLESGCTVLRCSVPRARILVDSRAA